MRSTHASRRMAAYVIYGDKGHLCAVARVERSATRVGMFDRNPSSIGLLNVRPGFRAAARKRARRPCIRATTRHLWHLWGERHLCEVPQLSPRRRAVATLSPMRAGVIYGRPPLGKDFFIVSASGSGAVMYPACLRGAWTAGPEGVRGRAPRSCMDGPLSARTFSSFRQADQVRSCIRPVCAVHGPLALREYEVGLKDHLCALEAR